MLKEHRVYVTKNKLYFFEYHEQNNFSNNHINKKQTSLKAAHFHVQISYTRTYVNEYKNKRKPYDSRPINLYTFFIALKTL